MTILILFSLFQEDRRDPPLSWVVRMSARSSSYLPLLDLLHRHVPMLHQAPLALLRPTLPPHSRTSTLSSPSSSMFSPPHSLYYATWQASTSAFSTVATTTDARQVKTTTSLGQTATLCHFELGRPLNPQAPIPSLKLKFHTPLLTKLKSFTYGVLNQEEEIGTRCVLWSTKNCAL